jgi:hypothetical protein
MPSLFCGLITLPFSSFWKYIVRLYQHPSSFKAVGFSVIVILIFSSLAYLPLVGVWVNTILLPFDSSSLATVTVAVFFVSTPLSSLQVIVKEYDPFFVKLTSCEPSLTSIALLAQPVSATASVEQLV